MKQIKIKHNVDPLGIRTSQSSCQLLLAAAGSSCQTILGRHSTERGKERERKVEREGATAAGVIFADLSLLSNEI